MKWVFLGLASNYRGKVWQHLTARGADEDYVKLRRALSEKYHGKAYLYHSGRSAIAAALEALLPKGGPVVIQGLTCIAVVRAVKAAKCTPFYSDIDAANLQFDLAKLEQTLIRVSRAEKNFTGGVIIVQNTLGITTDMAKIEKLAAKYRFIILEDLAHSAGRLYPDGREVGTVGAATALSFGKGKAIDTINGGALIIDEQYSITTPQKMPSLGDRYRDRVYPLIASFARATWGLGAGRTGMKRLTFRPSLGKMWLALAVKMHRVQRSADTKLDTTVKLPNWQAKLALAQLNNLPQTPLREFALVAERAEFLEKAKNLGFEIDEIWYDTPVSPARYAAEAEFTPENCPNTVEIAKQIINIPTWYNEPDLLALRQLIREANREK